MMVENLFSATSELVLILDRTRWSNTNILMISVAWKKRGLPIYWKILSHKARLSKRCREMLAAWDT